MSEITGIHHVTMFTKSGNENKHFYTDILGLKLVLHTVHQENFSIRHLFYGDANGSPGTLLSFFVLPKAGKSYLNNHYFGTITLKIPEKSLIFWQKRLETNNIETTKKGKSLLFHDTDNLSLRLTEVSDEIKNNNATTHSDIPKEKQIIGIMGQQIVVEYPEKEQKFLKEWLGLKGNPLTNNRQSFSIDILPSTNSDKTRFGRGAIDHLALTVESNRVLEQLKENATHLGYTVEMLKDRGYFSSLYVKDPFNQRFEIATSKPGIPKLESPEELTIPKQLKKYENEIKHTLGGNING